VAQHPIKQVILLAGPTAVGKSAVALALAEKLGGEIISVDSMQVYRGLDIGTAKPSVSERARVPHHLIDVAELNEPFDAARFVRLAQPAIAEIQSRGRSPIFCGGTGLYFKAFLAGLGTAPPSDEKLRGELEATPLANLLGELERRDPATFATIDRQNPRRVVRAVEVIRLTGQPFSKQRAEWPAAPLVALASQQRVSGPASTQLVAKMGTPPEASAPFFCFDRGTPDLHARINARVDEMFALGLVEETRRLLEHGLAQNKTAMQAIGYRQVVEHLRGPRSLRETMELVKSKTRQFAKRQRTWFRKHANAQWIKLEPHDSAEQIAAQVQVQCAALRAPATHLTSVNDDC
jgi:tRNA dimethylallyltransferase